MPERALIVARISDARDGDEQGVTGQVGDALQLARRLGWQVGPEATHHIVENDTSAYKRKRIRLLDGRMELRTVRPGFRQALAMLADGRADGLIALDLDRTCRDPRDLEDLIDVVEASRPRIPVESVTGSLRLASDGDVTMARVLVALANKSSRDTARRVSRARLRLATDGRNGAGGRRPFGWDNDRETIREAEAAEIRQWADAILAGVSLRQITAGIRDRCVPSVTGATWSSETVRDMLLRPRNAGYIVHRPDSAPGRKGPPYSDADLAGRGPWDPILQEATWRAVCAVLTDPTRRNGRGNTPRYLGTRIYFCGKCDDGTTLVTGRHDSGAERHTRYTCKPERQLNDLPMAERRWHLSRQAARVDEYVEEVLTARLRRPDAADLIAAPAEVDLVALRAEETSIRELLREQARLHARRVITIDQLEAGSVELQASLERARFVIAAAEESSPLAGIAGRADIDEIWPTLDLGRKRAILRVLADVTVLPGGRTSRMPDGGYFNADTVEIDFTKRRRSQGPPMVTG